MGAPLNGEREMKELLERDMTGHREPQSICYFCVKLSRLWRIGRLEMTLSQALVQKTINHLHYIFPLRPNLCNFLKRHARGCLVKYDIF